MFADSAFLHQAPPDAAKFDRQAFLNMARRGTSLPASSAAKEETTPALLLEYADFVLDQEARYCQQ
jgi:hypothetical protein